MGRAWTILDGCLASSGEVAPDMPAGGADASRRAGGQTVCLIGVERASEALGDRLAAEVVEQLPHAAMPFAELSEEGAVGIVVLPAAGRRAADAPRFAFELGPTRLLIVDDTGTCAPLLDALVLEAAPVGSPADVLRSLFHVLLREHPETLSRVRGDFEAFEQLILEGRERIDRAKMMADSRRMLGLNSFYQGLSDIVDLLAESDASWVPQADRARFSVLSRQLDRLSARLESLQNYALQVSGLYQEGIDVRQNNVMQWLTVVTTIAMPLTVITGWYGMNFSRMGLTDTTWGYPLVTCICIAIVLVEVAVFHRRGWLSFGGRRRRRK